MRNHKVLAGIAVLLAVLFLVPASYAQQTRLRVDGDRIKSYIEWLSRDEMEGRQTMTAGYRKAAEWVAEHFKEWGLEPAGENGTYFQQVPIGRALTFRTGMPDLRVGRTTFLLEEGDFTMNQASTVATSVNAEVVFVGYGLSNRRKGLDEYSGVNVRDKVVLILKGNPNDTPDAGGGRGGSMGPGRLEPVTPIEWTADEITDAAKIKTAYDKGAAAVLLYEPNPPAPPAEGQRGQRAGGQRGGAPGAALQFERDFLVFEIEGRVFRAIMKPDRQETLRGFDKRFNLMRQAIKRKNVASVDTGVRVRLKGFDAVEEYSAELGNNFGRNVIAKIVGADPDLKEQFVIMGGHLDHLGVRNGVVYNGADDNASGSAVTMEIGRVLSEANFKPKRTIIFCCWCGEEMGLIGSTYYTNNPCDGVTMDQVVTYFNMDMVGLGDRIGAPGALNFPSIYDVIKRDQLADVIGAVDARTGGAGGSDHSGFITRGIEALALMTSGGFGHPYYHQPEDDTVYIDPVILYKTGQFVLQGTINLANETETELLIPNRQAIFNARNVSITNFNPDLGGSIWRYIEIADNKEALQNQIKERAAQLAQQQQQQQAQRARLQRGGARGAGGRINQGIKNLKVFEGDADLLKSAAETLGFGRIDIVEEDGTWFANGRITRAGRAALTVMEESNIALHLIDPDESLIEAMLEAATKPFIITGTYTINEDMFDPVNEKNVLLGINFDPTEVEDVIARLDNAKEVLGDSDNLVLFCTTAEGLDDAKVDLYLGLVEKGWETAEIGGAGGRRGGGGGVLGGNLSILSPRPTGRIR